MNNRRCFLGFFAICLACVAGAFFATLCGLPYTI
jgi:hypothetical protein